LERVVDMVLGCSRRVGLSAPLAAISGWRQLDVSATG
jgi:hypothetical protein